MRQFLAIELPDSLRGRLAGLQELLRRRCDGWRWTRPSGIHLTLRFLGDVDRALDTRARSAWAAAVVELPPFRFRLRGLGCFPHSRRPRVLWIGVEELGSVGVLAALGERLERAAREIGFEPEGRPFRPHLTLARAVRGRRAEGDLGGIVEPDDDVGVDRVVLFRSELRPDGARYTPLAAFPLKGGGEPT